VDPGNRVTMVWYGRKGHLEGIDSIGRKGSIAIAKKKGSPEEKEEKTGIKGCKG